MRKNKIYFGGNDKQLKKFLYFCLSFSLLFVAFACFQTETFAQNGKKTKTAAKKKPAKIIIPDRARVNQIDAAALNNLLKREGDAAKPLLINFWATWCVPCVEEFPELVKIDADYRGKIDLITISLDDLAEINRDVPKFLANVKATMPAYLLKTQNEEAAIASVSKDWKGGLPFTILFDAKGVTVYIIQGKFKPDFLRNEIDKTIATGNSSLITNEQINILPVRQYTYEEGKKDARKDIADGKFFIRTYGMRPGIYQKRLDELKEKYGIRIFDDSIKSVEYLKGYNEISKAEIKRRFGLNF